MSTCIATFLLLLATAIATDTKELDLVQAARALVLQNRKWIGEYSTTYRAIDQDHKIIGQVALRDCDEHYSDSESLLGHLLSNESYTRDDARSWLSGVIANHRTCLDGLREKQVVVEAQMELKAQNLTQVISEALALFAKRRRGARMGIPRRPRRPNLGRGMLTSWNPATSRAHFVVAMDGSGSHRAINDALAAVDRMGNRRPSRVIIYVKAGVYNENVEIDKTMNNLMFVGDGIDRTIVTGNRNVPDGASTYNSATFAVSGDGFWARDMTFENTAGPQKYQAVALRVKADNSLFFRCSFKAYQDTLWTHSLRQFYRDCQIYGTIDFIFGDASAVFQNCDIFVRRPMNGQANMITAQGREDPNENTAISIQGSRFRPAPDLAPVLGSFKTFLGRPWKKYSRTVIFKSDLDGMINPSGWREWRGNFALSTLFYAEYMNSGNGASTASRVRWPGFHVLSNEQEASPFTVGRLIQGDSWIPVSGVPFDIGV